ncbi:MAG: hypothetical protein U0172_13860 [Nitrospiraceae bacterium]
MRLVLVSAAAVMGGLGLAVWMAAKPSREVRPLYASKDECLREWSDGDCDAVEEEPRHSTSSSGSGRYRGPSVSGYTIRHDGRAERSEWYEDRVPPRSRALAVERGGFGRTGSHFSGGS